MARELTIGDLDFAELVRFGDTVHWGQAAAEPVTLIERLNATHRSIPPFSVFLGIGYGPGSAMSWSDNVRFLSYCGTGSNRSLSRSGRLDIVPCHYSDLPALLARQVSVLLLQLSPADGEGRYSLGLANENIAGLIDSARLVIAEVNETIPFTFGERFVTDDDIDIVVRTSRPAIEVGRPTPDVVDRAIARNVATLIENGATLQIGIGSLPDAILSSLTASHLGIHSGMIGDSVAGLMKAGVVTNERKSVDPGVAVAGFLAGSRMLYDFCHRNPKVCLRSTDYTHSHAVLGQLDRFVSLNSAIEVDLTGQINSEVAGGRYVGAVGGAIDFMRGAHHSKGGLAIVALPSTVGSGETARSRIVVNLAGPTTISRADAGLIVTEHGIADMRNRSIVERTRALIAIAAPQFREQLKRQSALRS